MRDVMDWNAIAAIGEAVGAAGVVVSIGYLSIQIRANTRATKAGASFDATHSWAEFNESTANWSDELFAACLRSFDPGCPASEFSNLEKGRLGTQFRALFQKLEGQYYLHKNGYLESGVWDVRKAWARSLVELPFYQEWWELELDQSIYSADFVQALMAENVERVDVVVSGVTR